MLLPPTSPSEVKAREWLLPQAIFVTVFPDKFPLINVGT